MSTAVASTGFSQEAFDAFLAARDEPAWLIDMRRKAWRRFQELPMPSVRDEEWMRTDIRLFKLDRFSLPEHDGHHAAANSLTRTRCWRRALSLAGGVVGMNSHGVAAELDPKLAAQGVLFGNLARLVREHGDLLRPFFERRVVDPHQGQVLRAERGLLVGRHAAVRAQERAARASRCIRCRRLSTAASIWARRW